MPWPDRLGGCQGSGKPDLNYCRAGLEAVKTASTRNPGASGSAFRPPTSAVQNQQRRIIPDVEEAEPKVLGCGNVTVERIATVRTRRSNRKIGH